VIGTGLFHDPDQLPGDLSEYDQGFIDHNGKFLTREEAAALLGRRKPLHSEQVLTKASPGMNEGAHAGFAGHEQPDHASKAKPKATQGDHEEGAATEKVIQDAADDAPPAPEMTHAAKDFEDQLHGLAQDQNAKDDQTSQQAQGHNDEVRKQVAQVLLRVREQMPILAQMQQTAQDAYAAIMGLVQGVILLGKEVMGDGPVADQEPSHVQQAVRKAEDETCPDCGAVAGKGTDCKTCAKKTEGEYASAPASDGEIEKAAGGPIAGAPAHHHLHLPVGSQVDGKVKVQHADGSQSWKGMRAGMIQGQEADAPLFGANSHPTSSREPGAR